MCIFTNDKDIPTYVRLSTRALQYLIIPLLSIAIISVGGHHLEDCPGQPNLPIWHIVAGCSGLLVPILYLLFDELNPALAHRCPILSELMDNTIVFIIPVYILFEVAWLLTGTVWVFSLDREIQECDATIYIFSVVVIINFWIHLLTPFFFVLSVCCSRVFPFIGYCTYWNLVKSAIDMWTFNFRFVASVLVSLPLGAAMIGVGVNGLTACKPSKGNQFEDGTKLGDDGLLALTSDSNSTISRLSLSWAGYGYLDIPVWLITAGVLLLLLPVVYTVYDKFCKSETINQEGKGISNTIVVLYLMFGLVWALVGFLWIFGTQNQEECNQESGTYKFAFASLIILNALMDIYICIKISVVLYWALLTEET